MQSTTGVMLQKTQLLVMLQKNANARGIVATNIKCAVAEGGGGEGRMLRL
jgi:hypothetical protein